MSRSETQPIVGTRTLFMSVLRPSSFVILHLPENAATYFTSVCAHLLGPSMGGENKHYSQLCAQITFINQIGHFRPPYYCKTFVNRPQWRSLPLSSGNGWNALMFVYSAFYSPLFKCVKNHSLLLRKHNNRFYRSAHFSLFQDLNPGRSGYIYARWGQE